MFTLGEQLAIRYWHVRQLAAECAGQFDVYCHARAHMKYWLRRERTVRLVAFCCSLLLAASVLAVEPKAVITGPDNVPAGMGFVLSAKGSQHDMCDGPVWHVPDILGEIYGGSVIFTKPAAGQYAVQLTVGGIVKNAAGKDEVKLDTATKIVTVGGAPVPPGPTPPPVPPPVPPAPSKFGLDIFTLQLANALPSAAKALCPSIAANFDAVASGAAHGTYATPAAMQDETAKRNIASEGVQQPTFKQAFFTPLAAKLVQLNAVNLKTLDDHVVAWREIATGLRGVTP